MSVQADTVRAGAVQDEEAYEMADEIDGKLFHILWNKERFRCKCLCAEMIRI